MNQVKGVISLKMRKKRVESLHVPSLVRVLAVRDRTSALGFVKLRDWKLRQRPDLKVKAIAGRAMGAFSQIKEAMVFAFPPPPVIELGMATGFRSAIAGPGRPGSR